MTTQTATTTQPTSQWIPSKDKYGRSTHHLYTWSESASVVIGAVCKLPKGWVDTYGTRYLSNDWSKRGEDAVRYHHTLAEAKARLESLI